MNVSKLMRKDLSVENKFFSKSGKSLKKKLN
jgi:hypothetical protein